MNSSFLSTRGQKTDHFAHESFRFLINFEVEDENLTICIVFLTAGVDMARLFNHVLLQQTQPEDSQGAITITNMYTTWLV